MRMSCLTDLVQEGLLSKQAGLKSGVSDGVIDNMKFVIILCASDAIPIIFNYQSPLNLSKYHPAPFTGSQTGGLALFIRWIWNIFIKTRSIAQA